MILMFSTLVDRLYYEQWTFPPFRFLYFNIAQALAIFYGKNDWHYYLSQGYPLLLTTFLPFGLIGVWQSLFPPQHPPQYLNDSTSTTTIKYQLAMTTVLVPFVLSFVSHKEVRFVYPILPPAPHARRRSLHDFFPSRCLPRHSSNITIHGQASPSGPSHNRQYRYRDFNDNIPPDRSTCYNDLSPGPTHKALSQPAALRVSRACTIFDDCWLFNALP